jgi:hypothetical protein
VMDRKQTGLINGDQGGRVRNGHEQSVMNEPCVITTDVVKDGARRTASDLNSRMCVCVCV